MTAYYNEIDPFAAEWLRNLIAKGLIASGDVDDRSIVDVRADDLRGYTQCHFFAGLGLWSHALRLAGWPDEREVWTGSCPCQPFSAAGKGEGYADERHLWPHWYRLISERRPATVFGEQVAAAIGTGWLDDVSLSLEELDYAVGSVSFPACSVGAPHIRQRLYFVAESNSAASERLTGSILGAQAQSSGAREFDGYLPERHWSGGAACGVADADGGKRGQGIAAPEKPEKATSVCSDVGHLGDSIGKRLERGAWQRGMASAEDDGNARQTTIGDSGAKNGFWSDCTWLPCTDGKARPTARPTQSVLQSLLDGYSSILGSAWDAYIFESQKEVDRYAEETGSRTDQALLAMWRAAASQTILQRVGGLDSIQEPQVLLIALCELARRMGAVSHSAASSVGEIQEGTVRALWHDPSELSPSSCPPQERKLEGSQTRELGNALRRLSSWWSQSAAKDSRFASVASMTAAIGCFPLAASVPGRVGILRAAGNAIVPPQAAEFIRAAMAAQWG